MGVMKSGSSDPVYLTILPGVCCTVQGSIYTREFLEIRRFCFHPFVHEALKDWD